MATTDKWKMNRAGLLNFWYYDEEIFDFVDGKLLLRGSNGSGKSVTMQSFLPVLLDGKKSPDRLDPFGSKARRMEDYLLGEKEVVNRDERTGYLFIEYKREHTNQYVTTGIGLQAKRYKPMKFWGFIITDNRRIGHDLQLYKMERQGNELKKIPRSRVELETVIADGGQVVQTQSDYMKLVNKYVFGFETIEAYEDLIKLLIQLRSPKLSKEFRPTVIYEILEAALPPLSDDDLRHLSDTIEQMDQTKQQIEQLERELLALTSLNKAYDTYNQRLIADQAVEYGKASKRLNKEEKQYKQLIKEQQELETEIGQLEIGISQLKTEQEVFEKKKQRLFSHKVWNIQKEREDEAQRLESSDEDYQRRSKKLSDQKKKEWELKDKKELVELTIDEVYGVIDDHLGQMRDNGEETAFSQHIMNEEDYKRNQDSAFDFTLWKKEAEKHKKNLAVLEEKLRKFDDLREKIQGKQKELGDEQYKLDQKRHEETDWLRMFDENKDKHIHQLHTWSEAYPQFAVTEDALQAAARNIYSLYETTTYEEIKDLFSPLLEAYQDQKRQYKSELGAKANQLDENIKVKEAELLDWKNKKDPEPEAHPATREARKALLDSGTNFDALYALVEFQEGVSEETQRRIEAAMIDAGLLNALIADEELDVEHDRILRASPNIMAHTLADYLKADGASDSTISPERVDDVLRSIVIGSNDNGTEALMSIQEDGSYGIGLIKGHATPIEQVRFIGKNARKRYREEQIVQIQHEIEELEVEKKSIIKEFRKTEDELQAAKTAWGQFPNDRDLQENYRQIELVRLGIKHSLEQVQEFSQILKELDVEYQELKRAIGEEARQYNLELSHQAYATAKNVMDSYEKDLLNLEIQHNKYIHHKSQAKDYRERLEEVAEEIIMLEGELNVLQSKIDTIRKNIEQIDKQLEQEGAEDIQQQISQVQSRLTEITNEAGEKNKLLPQRQTELKNHKEKLAEKQKLFDFYSKIKDAWKQSLESEVKRGYVVKSSEEETLDEIAKKLEQAYGEIVKEKDKSNVESRLTSEFYRQQTDLMEYRMREYMVEPHTFDWMENEEQDSLLPIIEQWKHKTARRIIELDWRGQQVSPYFVQQNIAEEQARQESLLNEQDKELYEEILFKSVGNKLRSRIRRAERWTDKMTSLMESRDSSSGLTFSIKWRPRTAEAEEEMDTKDLVHILKQDAQLLREQDLERITSHFRSKISKAKKWIEEKGEGQTLLQVLKEVLDYRKWFSFILYYQRTNEAKRELTNNTFYKFSGGEKAMAMYIPLFAACYSRYQEAADTAPYIISLDEAFAGVDENNIREMFEIVEHLGFDYIMNSQVLWGDYDTISSLAVCELVRPKNASYVTVIPYKWDGNQMNLELKDVEHG
ncbi:uncharacterized protein (TIGR02680 family) [Desulfitispora alkaliphila]|uniref:TIGR02680 family protein n=1 Tax=Desulfitispora alkaliphila TaxID=622674 RepID=UPI003D1FA0AA